MPKLLLNESSATLRASEDSGGRWKATLITPGQGSSGTYSETMLQEHAATAFPKGTKMFFNHPKDGQAGGRDPRDQWGYLSEDAKYEPGVGITGVPEVLPHAKEIVDSLGTQAALSVWVMGEADEQKNVTALLPDVTNSVDMVAYPGRPGSGLTEKMYEAFREASEMPGVTSAQDQTKKDTMEKEILEALQALKTSFDSFVSESKTSADAKVQAEADAAAAKDSAEQAVEKYDTAVKAIDDAKLLPSQAESLRAAAKRGEDVTELIEQAKKIASEAKATFTESATNSLSGRYVSAPSNDDFSIRGL